jgi:hypothetical protein
LVCLASPPSSTSHVARLSTRTTQRREYHDVLDSQFGILLKANSRQAMCARS